MEQRTSPSPLLRMEGIAKSFPGVRALKNAGLELHAGEVLALLGENGAGKSTLIKILSGVHRPDAGSTLLGGRTVAFPTPLHAREAGISVIHQEFNLVPSLTARENIFLGCAEARRGFISRRRERDKALELFRRLDVAIDPDTLCRDLSVSRQQIVEIARALHAGGRILVMDEPTAALSGAEVRHLLDIVHDLRRSGIGIVYISHRLDEVFEIADRVTVMRDGEHVATRAIGDVDRRQIIEMMVGRPLESEYPKTPAEIGPERLRVEGLSRGRAVRDASFSARRGEILGIAGLVGAGRTELARLIFGADVADSGRIFVDGREIAPRSPLDAIRAGICLLTEDRKAQGLVLALSVRENFALPNLGRWSSFGFIDGKGEAAAFDGYAASLRIKISGREQRAGNLSGGNQQKVVLAKWLETRSEIVIFDEPTRGIDVGAKHEIYQMMCDLARRGKCILMISSELPELLGMCDRLLVMHEGRIRGEIADVRAATQESILAMAVGCEGRTAEGRHE